MTLDERLPELLAREAPYADTVPPSLAGVQAAVARRARRRQRQRVAGAVIAVAVLLGGTAAALAVLRNDADTTPIIDRLDQVPLVGIDHPGWDLVRASVGPRPDGDDPPVTFAYFGGTTGAEPLLAVAYGDGTGASAPLAAGGVVEPDPVDEQVDLGPVVADLRRGPGGVGVTWAIGDGRTLGVGTHGVEEGDLVDYARRLAADPVDLDHLPEPPGLTPRGVYTVPAAPPSTLAASSYEARGGTITVRVTDEPGRFELLLLGQAYGAEVVDEVPVGGDLVGPATAALTHPSSGTTVALWRTPSGLTVEVRADGVADDVVQQLLADGRFVEVAPTTAGAAAPAGHLVDFRGNPRRLELEFAAPPPHVVGATFEVEPDARCGDAVARYEERILDEFGHVDTGSWLSIEVEGDLDADTDGPLVDDDGEMGAIVCDHASALPIIAVPFDGEPLTYAVSDRADPPSILIVLDGATPPDTSITDVRLGHHEGFDRVVIEFAEALPDIWEVTTSDTPATGECVNTIDDGASYVNVHLGLTASALQEPINELVPPEGSAILHVTKACEFEGFVDLVIILDTSEEPAVTELHGPPRAVIDIPR